jgi:hypothetical protein
MTELRFLIGFAIGVLFIAAAALGVVIALVLRSGR